MIFGGEAGDVPEQFSACRDEGELLELPLVDVYRGGGDLVQERGVGQSGLQHAAELGGSGAFLARSGEQDRATRFYDVGGGGDAFDRLVEREVERVAGGGGDDGVGGFVEFFPA